MEEDLGDRVTILETEQKNKWEAHDKAAELRQAFIKDEFAKSAVALCNIETEVKLVGKTCLTRPATCMTCLENSIIKKVKLYISLALGIPATVLAGVGVVRLVLLR